MAQVALTTVWVHRLSDPSLRVKLPSTAAGEATSQGGQVLTFAGGFRRAIVTDEHSRSVRYTAPVMPRAAYDLLREWRGEPIVIRDPMRRLIHAVAFDVAGDEAAPPASLPNIPVGNVVLSATEIDRSPVEF